MHNFQGNIYAQNIAMHNQHRHDGCMPLFRSQQRLVEAETHDNVFWPAAPPSGMVGAPRNLHPSLPYGSLNPSTHTLAACTTSSSMSHPSNMSFMGLGSNPGGLPMCEPGHGGSVALPFVHYPMPHTCNSNSDTVGLGSMQHPYEFSAFHQSNMALPSHQNRPEMLQPWSRVYDSAFPQPTGDDNKYNTTSVSDKPSQLHIEPIDYLPRRTKRRAPFIRRKKEEIPKDFGCHLCERAYGAVSALRRHYIQDHQTVALQQAGLKRAVDFTAVHARQLMRPRPKSERNNDDINCPDPSAENVAKKYRLHTDQKRSCASQTSQPVESPESNTSCNDPTSHLGDSPNLAPHSASASIPSSPVNTTYTDHDTQNSIASVPQHAQSIETCQNHAEQTSHSATEIPQKECLNQITVNARSHNPDSIEDSLDETAANALLCFRSRG